MKPEKRIAALRRRRSRDRQREIRLVDFAVRLAAQPEHVIAGFAPGQHGQRAHRGFAGSERDGFGGEPPGGCSERIDRSSEFHRHRPAGTVVEPGGLHQRFRAGVQDLAGNTGTVHADRQRSFGHIGSGSVPLGQLECVEPDGHALRLGEAQPETGDQLLRPQPDREAFPFARRQLDAAGADGFVFVRIRLDRQLAGPVGGGVAADRVGAVGTHHPKEIAGGEAGLRRLHPQGTPPVKRPGLIGRQLKKSAAPLEGAVAGPQVHDLYRFFRLRRGGGEIVDIELAGVILPPLQEEKQRGGVFRDRVRRNREPELPPVEGAAGGAEHVHAAAGRHRDPAGLFVFMVHEDHKGGVLVRHFFRFQIKRKLQPLARTERNALVDRSSFLSRREHAVGAAAGTGHGAVNAARRRNFPPLFVFPAVESVRRGRRSGDDRPDRYFVDIQIADPVVAAFDIEVGTGHLRRKFGAGDSEFHLPPVMGAAGDREAVHAASGRIRRPADHLAAAVAQDADFGVAGRQAVGFPHQRDLVILAGNRLEAGVKIVALVAGNPHAVGEVAAVDDVGDDRARFGFPSVIGVMPPFEFLFKGAVGQQLRRTGGSTGQQKREKKIVFHSDTFMDYCSSVQAR